MYGRICRWYVYRLLIRHKLNKNVVKYNNEARKIGMGVDA